VERTPKGAQVAARAMTVDETALDALLDAAQS
jgi:hypothetical protein